jgi:hypothetical protein
MENLRSLNRLSGVNFSGQFKKIKYKQVYLHMSEWNHLYFSENGQYLEQLKPHTWRMIIA